VAQELYDGQGKKIITYPRAEVRYLAAELGGRVGSSGLASARVGRALAIFLSNPRARGKQPPGRRLFCLRNSFCGGRWRRGRRAMGSRRFERARARARRGRVDHRAVESSRAREAADSVCTTWGVKEQRLYLLHVLRKRMAYPDLKRAVREQHQTFKATVVLIEDKASGTQLIQELAEEGIHAVSAYRPEYDKVMRLHAQTATIENGFVYLPREAHWLGEYVHEVTTFPAAKYDDQADSTSQALAWTKQRPPGWGFLEWIRSESEAQRAGTTQHMIKLQAPRGISHVSTLSGRQIAVAPDGTIEVSEEDAKPLLGAGFQRIRYPRN